jgi:hypothetical protein
MPASALSCSKGGLRRSLALLIQFFCQFNMNVSFSFGGFKDEVQL